MKAVANIVQERRLLEEVSTRSITLYLSDHRLTILSSSICDTPFKTTRTVSSSWTSCLGATLGVSLCTRPHLTPVHLDRAGAMNEETVRFYVAEIAMAVDYLHRKRIVHR